MLRAVSLLLMFFALALATVGHLPSAHPAGSDVAVHLAKHVTHPDPAEEPVAQDVPELACLVFCTGAHPATDGLPLALAADLRPVAVVGSWGRSRAPVPDPLPPRLS